MFRRPNRVTGHCVIAAPRVASVRLLETPEDLRAAVERAREFERRRAARSGPVGRYERYLVDQPLAGVVQLSGAAGA
jgi:hypothetical protein